MSLRSISPASCSLLSVSSRGNSVFDGAISTILWALAGMVGLVGVVLVVLAVFDRAAEGAQRDR